MNLRLWWVGCAVAVMVAGLPLRAAEPAPAREDIEWVDIWIAHTDKKDLPHVLLVGDSITRGYFPVVEKRLAGKAYVSRLAGSRCVGDPVLLEELKLVLGHDRFEVIHFNNGMHGWDNSDEFYGRHFPQFLATIRALSHGARLMWATTTPVRVVGRLGDLAPRTDRVKVRNAMAARLIEAAGIPTDDLFGLVLNHPEYWDAKGGGVHFNEAGRQAEGEQVATAVAALLPAAD